MPHADGRPGDTGAPGPFAVHLVAIFAAYVVTARLGLAMDAVSGFATAVWPPTGISLVAVWVLGYRIWPAVGAGAFVANLLAGAPLLVAAGMATGNTLEALVAAYLLHRHVGFRPALDRLPDAVGLTVLAGLVSTAVSATLGVTSGWLGGVIPAGDVATAWPTWWIGDMIADLVLAPLLFTWIAYPRPARERRRAIEAAALATSVLAIGYLVFGRAPGEAATSSPHLLFPLVIWAALRFGPRGAATTTFAVSVIAVAGTSFGFGPFQSDAMAERLLALQVFMGVVAVTSLVLAAVSAERHRTHEEMRFSLDQKVALLHEVHHRVKNNLQVISSLLRLQSGAVDDVRVQQILKDSQERVRAMALVHERLYADRDFERVDLGAYIRGLTLGLIQSYGLDHRVKTDVDAQGIPVPIETAIPCGLLTQELVSNALKHAFPDRRGGHLQVSIQPVDDGRVALTVADDGVGLPDGIDLREARSMGLRIVAALTTQLKADLETHRGQGTRIVVTFPVTTQERRRADEHPGRFGRAGA